MGPLRILQIYPKADYFTGAAIQLHQLVRGLRERGHHVTVATSPSAEWPGRCRDEGIPHVAIPMRKPLDPRGIWGLARLIARERPDIVHCQKGRARTLAMAAGLLVRLPPLVLNRGVSFPVGRWHRLGYTSRRVTAIVAVCESIKRGLVAAGVPAAKIEVIYSGTDLARFHPHVDGSAIRRRLGLTPEHVLVTQVGVRSWRGNDDVLRAMTRVHAAAPHARLLFVGAPAGAIHDWHARAGEAGLADVVTVWGHREDIPEILAASDLAVDASYAGLGLTGSIREALAVETPVVATAVEGMPELVVDGETGFLVPPRNPDALAHAMLRVIESPARARTMARAGRKRVEAGFSLAVKVERTEALYRRLVADRARATA